MSLASGVQICRPCIVFESHSHPESGFKEEKRGNRSRALGYVTHDPNSACCLDAKIELACPVRSYC